MWLTGFSLLFYCFIVLNKTIYLFTFTPPLSARTT